MSRRSSGLLLVVGIALVARAVTAHAQLELLSNDHQLGYKVAPDRTATPPGVSFNKGVQRAVDDQFAQRACFIVKEKILFTPADKNGEGVQDATRHYVGYQVKCSPKTGGTVTYVDQFFPAGLAVTAVKPSYLMTPSGKSLTLVPDPPPPPAGTNHYLCYKAKAPKLASIPPVTVVDQFGTRELLLRKIRSVCNPANKNGEDPGATTDPDHYICYQVTADSKPSPNTVRTNNLNFSSNTLVAKKYAELCVPAYDIANPPTTSTTIVTTTTTTTTTTSTTTSSTTTSSTTTSTTTTTTTSTTTTTTLPCPFVTQWGTPGGAPSPAYIDVDAGGDVYVVANRNVLRYTNGGSFVTSWDVGPFTGPEGIAVDANVFTPDTTFGQGVRKFTNTGTFIGFFCSQGTADGLCDQPRDVAIDGSGNVYVADRGNSRIQKFTNTGTFITKWGTAGSGNGQFNTPSGLAVSPITGNILATDTGNNRVQEFTNTGAFVATWGVAGAGDGEFNTPLGIAVDDGGNVYVADQGNHRIQIFTSSGTFVAKMGSLGSGDGQFNNPVGVAVDASRNLFVSDRNNNRVQKFACP